MNRNLRYDMSCGFVDSSRNSIIRFGRFTDHDEEHKIYFVFQGQYLTWLEYLLLVTKSSAEWT